MTDELTDEEKAALALQALLEERYDSNAEKPDAFHTEDWTIVKEQGQTIAATHAPTGTTRKLPRAWFK